MRAREINRKVARPLWIIAFLAGLSWSGAPLLADNAEPGAPMAPAILAPSIPAPTSTSGDSATPAVLIQPPPPAPVAIPSPVPADTADNPRPSGGVRFKPSIIPTATADGIIPLAASQDVTAVSGRVVTVDGLPLAGVPVTDGDVAATTDGQGRYLLAGVKPGNSVITLDARKAGPGAADYGYYQIQVNATEGVTNVLPYKNWLSKIDHAHDVTIPSPTTSEVVVTNPDLPGIELHIPAGTILTAADHKPVTTISMTPVPNDRTPYPLPHNVTVPQYFVIQPGDATATGIDGKWVGAQLWYPNYRHQLPGARETFWRYDAYGAGWVTYGTGTVSVDGQHVIPDQGVRLYDIAGAMFNGGTPPAHPGGPGNPGGWPGAGPGGAPGGGPGGGGGGSPGAGGSPSPGDGPPSSPDPVDLSTGLWTLSQTDLTLSDVVPITILRTYRQDDPNTRSFGVGMTLSYETYLWSANPYQEVDLITPSGGRIHFDRISPGTGFVDAVLRSTNAPGVFYNATISWNGTGWDMRLADGSLYVFGENAPLQYFQDRFGNRTTLIRDTPAGLIKGIVSPNGRWVKLTYNANNTIATATDNTGRTISYGYDTSNHLTTVTDPHSGVTTYGWGTVSGSIETIRSPRQQPSGPVLITNEYYTTDNRLKKQTFADGSTHSFTYAVDANNKVTEADTMLVDSVHPSPGITRKTTFNSDGYWLTDKFGVVAPPSALEQDSTAVRGGSTPPGACSGNTTANSPINALIALTDPLGRLTCQTYNATGSILTRTFLAGTPSAVTYTYTYGVYGQLASTQDPLGHVSTFGLDSLGRVTSLVNALGGSAHTWNIAPNPNGQIASITDPLNSGHTTSFNYDHGDLISVTDPLGRASKLYTDNLGRTIQALDPRIDLWQWAYDPYWGVHIATDANSNAVTTNYNADGLVSNVVDPRSSGITTQYSYDTSDRLTIRTDPLTNNDTINSYDGFNNPLTTTDRKGQNAAYTYDLIGRIATATFADGHSLVYTWDNGNRLTRVDDTLAGTTNSVIRGYDGLDRLTSEQVIQGATTIGTVTYTYDNAGRRTTMIVPNGAGTIQYCYVYDNADRLTNIKQGTGANCATSPTLLETFTYYNNDLLNTVSLPNSVIGTYQYDNANELTNITYTKSSTTLGDLQYFYDAAGRVSTRGGTLFKSVLPTATDSLHPPVYNNDNQLTSWNNVAASYDLNGNLTGDGAHTYTWDARNRMTAVTGAASFVYDAVGRRLSVTQGATTTAAVYDGYDPVQEQSPIGTVAANVQTGRGIDQRFTRTVSGTASYYLTDLLGSTVGITNATGTAVQTTYSYDPFGVTALGGTANTNPYKFTGRQDDNTGLYYFRARYYSPAWGRFVSEDPIGFSAGINLYAYVGGNPISLRDSFGKMTMCVSGEEEACNEVEMEGDVVHNPGVLRGGGMVPDQVEGDLLSDEGATYSQTPIGRSGNPIRVPGGTNEPAVINGREYTGHALDQMQARGVTPTPVQDAIENGTVEPGNEINTLRFNGANGVRVILGGRGQVITVIY